MRRWKRDRRRGESIVEVMVSAVIFLLLMAVLQGAVMFSHSAQRKSRQIRQDTAEICVNLRTVPSTGNGSDTYQFYATSADGTITGSQVFSVGASKQKKTVTYEKDDGSQGTVTFYVYGTNGGGTP